MSLKSFLLIFALWWYGSLHAQYYLYSPRYIDSLQQLLSRPVSDSSKARVHFQLATYWVSKDTLKAREHIARGRQAASSSPFLTQVGNATEAYYLFYTGATDQSEALYKKVEEGLAASPVKEALSIRSAAWSSRAVMRQKADDDKGYIRLMLSKAIPLAKQANDSASVATHYVGVGVAFMNLDQNEKAAAYFDQAIPILLRLKAESRLIAAYKRSGENYVLLKKWDNVRETLAAFRKILFKYPESDQYAGYYMIEGLYLKGQKQYKEAVQSFDKAIEKASGPNKAYVIDELNFYKLDCLLKTKEYGKALTVLKALSSDQRNMEMDQNRLEVYHKSAQVYAGLNDYAAAYRYQTRYANLSDSLHESRFRNDINDMEARYKTAESEKQVASLKAANAQAALQANKNRLFNIVLGGACLLLLAFAIFYYFYYRSHKKLLKQEAVNHRQQLKELAQQHQLTITRSILEGEERERERLARDLHDGLGGLLSGVKMNFSSWAKSNLAPSGDGPFNKIMGQLDHSVGELRRVARNLMPQSLIEFGLVTALKDLCGFYIKEGFRIDFQPIGIDPGIDRLKQVHIYRIIQELLSNTIKHAQASEVLLQCSQNGGRFFITLEDNGVGFLQEEHSRIKGSGIKNIKNRVNYLGGQLDIRSEPGNGTVVSIELNLV
ncbi:tetratricopeptide repeat-containing sensor histidine kinase [Niabella aurantiaca]|uniref:tetratricopeptide repeat-containing sensor histidine kinase n=1 Tax=Niabella aurantiaca TaxID=379900 RepID=UPI00037AD6DD|nr:ATP-binding protein [Niabella aurantiaca]